MASELYPKKSMKTEDPGLSVPYPILPGESVEFLGKTADGVIALSNFRLLAKHGTVVMNIPLALVDTIECRDIFFLYVYCKDARSFRYVAVIMNSMKLVIPLRSLYWSIHTKDESKRGTAFACIFGVN